MSTLAGCLITSFHCRDLSKVITLSSSLVRRNQWSYHRLHSHVPSGVLGLAHAKQQASSSRTGVHSIKAFAAVGLATIGALGMAFYDGLWVPLLRDADNSDGVKYDLQALGVTPRLSLLSHTGNEVVSRIVADIKEGAAVIVDGFLSDAEIKAAREDISKLESMPGILQLNPKVAAGNSDIRTDRVCYLRDENKSFCGDGLRFCHKLLRGLACDLSEPDHKCLLVPNWAQLAVYEEGGGFYTWHTDGLEFPNWYWLFGPFALLFYFRWGAIRRRAITGIVYLNEGTWLAEQGGALRCRTHGVRLCDGKFESLPRGTNDYIDIWPHGGRLVLFDSQKVEHEVASTQQKRWALTVWIHE